MQTTNRGVHRNILHTATSAWIDLAARNLLECCWQQRRCALDGTEQTSRKTTPQYLSAPDICESLHKRFCERGFRLGGPRRGSTEGRKSLGIIGLARAGDQSTALRSAAHKTGSICKGTVAYKRLKGVYRTCQLGVANMAPPHLNLPSRWRTGNGCCLETPLQGGNSCCNVHLSLKLRLCLQGTLVSDTKSVFSAVGLWRSGSSNVGALWPK
jgi:hypothetical protein